MLAFQPWHLLRLGLPVAVTFSLSPNRASDIVLSRDRSKALFGVIVSYREFGSHTCGLGTLHLNGE